MQKLDKNWTIGVGVWDPPHRNIALIKELVENWTGFGLLQSMEGFFGWPHSKHAEFSLNKKLTNFWIDQKLDDVFMNTRWLKCKEF
jgi:hypothetical protein